MLVYYEKSSSSLHYLGDPFANALGNPQVVSLLQRRPRPDNLRWKIPHLRGGLFFDGLTRENSFAKLPAIVVNRIKLYGVLLVQFVAKWNVLEQITQEATAYATLSRHQPKSVSPNSFHQYSIARSNSTPSASLLTSDFPSSKSNQPRVIQA
ncbi:MAG TPA: hypothetical protein DEV72_12280 [Ktedonobacter sp.]|jgi:hypothetical protein|nr:hypothetical protein [Ktedonobacter sp.]HCF85969.1 hypothetical protein [Ktedonobacter sp.]HCP74775.1 hypothetical protein [Ktedonobacter sp.]